MSGRRYTWGTLARELALVAVAVAFAVPVYVAVVLSLKDPLGTLVDPLSVPRDPEVGNYADAWRQGGDAGLGNALLTSTIVTLCSVTILIVLGSLCAWALARRTSKLSTGVFLLFVAGIILPFQLGIVPIYVVMADLGLVGNLPGVVLLYVGLAMPLTVFLYTGFIRALPREYEEAAHVDGSGWARTFAFVVFPLLRPVTATVAILTGIATWNDFFVPLIFLSGSGHETITVALYSFVGGLASQWNLIFAGIVISIAPILVLYLLAQRHLIRGFASGVRG